MDLIQQDKIKEACGIFGIYDTGGGAAAHSIYMGLNALQHRGQESCGIAVSDTNGPKGNIQCRRGMGLVNEVFHEEDLEKLPGNLGIGHVRYSTTGAPELKNAQPLVMNYIKGTLALAHNGNLVNTGVLRKNLEQTGALFHTDTDSEVIAYCIARERIHTKTVEEAVLNTARMIRGAYALVIASPRKLTAIRDPLGIKPLCLGKKGSAYVIASEDCALRTAGAEFLRDIRPGEMVTVTENEVISNTELCREEQAHCIFEYIYFARLDSTLDGVNIYDARIRAGAALAQSFPADADLVCGVPDSGIPAAKGYSEASGIPFGLAFYKNSYVGRTFIKPTQEETGKQRSAETVCPEIRGKRETSGAGGRLHRAGHDHLPPDPDAEGSRRQKRPCTHQFPALPPSLLLRDGRPVEPAAHRLFPFNGGDPGNDRRGLPRLYADRRPPGHGRGSAAVQGLFRRPLSDEDLRKGTAPVSAHPYK